MSENTAKYAHECTFYTNGYGPIRRDTRVNHVKIDWRPLIAVIVIFAPVIYIVLH